MAEMVGSELSFESVGGMAEGRAHHAGIGDHQVELAAVGVELVGRGTNALQFGKVELDQLDVLGSRFTEGALGLGEVARRTDDLGTVRCKRSRGLHSKTGRHTGHEYALAGEIDAGEHVFGRGFGSKLLGHIHLHEFHWLGKRPLRRRGGCGPMRESLELEDASA